MDSSSTASEHSNVSSRDSPIPRKQPSPNLSNNNNSNANNNNNSNNNNNNLNTNNTSTNNGSINSSSPTMPTNLSNNVNMNLPPRSPSPSPVPLNVSRTPSSPVGGGGPPHLPPPPNMHSPMSPPPVSTPNSLTGLPHHRLSMTHIPGLPPHSLGLLNSLQSLQHHASPLDLMAVAHHHGPPRSYNSPPPISCSDPTANECKLVEYRGQKVAAFIISGDTMLCLPQAFELFLKHLVGGLHTVYTKLKRLDIVPLVCNVEQVRILRGLGAIQPGVNRCKLLSCKDFDILYRDCTTASSRPGRPPKRAPVGLSLAASQLAGHPALKKRMENGDYAGYENGSISDPPRLEKSPLLANGYNHPPTHLNHMQFMQLSHPAAAHTAILSPAGMQHPGLQRPDGNILKNQMPGMEAIARSGIWENCRAAYEDIVKHLERLREERGDTERALALDQKVRELNSQNGSPNNPSPVLNLSKSGGGSHGEASGSEAGQSGPEDEEEDDNLTEVDEDDDKDPELSDVERPELPASGSPRSECQALNYSTLSSGTGTVNPSVGDSNLNSTETLLRNIQGLLKVAADNARQQERQINYEKAELKMDILREREMKDSLERQLMDEQKTRVLYQKRLKKEKKARRRLQEQLELEIKRRSQLEEAIKNTNNPAEALRLINESAANAAAAAAAENEEKPRERLSSSVQGKDRSESPFSRSQQTISEREKERELTNEKQWNYSGLDIMNSGNFWQNYSEYEKEKEETMMNAINLWWKA
ncbi:dachshund, putative [Pediculus humanus corporis]|uniref:Dachshund, putative n=1 Tax=Pediculus humanus subsp. corporis TaxID=121224 RepID=E0VP24_PEDHC|nr:dachshund, putative [Pediculus humanus corporis]EEB15130.1 dachshund, putative [Pediculus humanus corporis]